MFKRIIFIVALVFSTVMLAQNYVKHTVLEGETIQSIAQKYKVTPYDIYKLNPDSQSGVKANTVVLIPKTSLVKTDDKSVDVKKVEPKIEVKTEKKPEIKGVETSKAKTHLVVAKETLYSISKKYDITIDALETLNPIIKTDGLQPGQILKVSKGTISTVEPPKVKSNAAVSINHEVKPKETKYGIATKYGITVEELEKQNPEVKENLPIGYILKINKTVTHSVVPKTEVFKAEVEKSKVEVPKVEVPKNNTLLEYTVKSGETLYSLTRQFGLSDVALINLNPALKDGVKEGMVLNVPSNLSFSNQQKNEFKDLTKSISSQDKKQLVLFLPFNISKIESDTLTSIGVRLKKDKFLNMTLDFYSGALMAIDSAKVLGINMDVKIYDSQETKNSTNALNVISENNFSKTNAVIGPFYQVNIEKVASALEDKNIPVISPLSKEEDGKSYKNLYQTIPSSDATKNALFDYMRSKNGNIIAVIDPKKNSIKEYINEFQKATKIVGLTEKGSIVGDSIKKYFVKDRMNYVIMASESTQTILSITTILQNAQKDFQIQLAILEPNETLDFDEIPLSRLTKLKMIYPSATNDNNSDLAQKFEHSYRKKNKIIPNQYATRGFDVTFDTILRLAQEKPFEQTLDVATEQVESKFDYHVKEQNGFINNGIYVLYYDTDLTIKQAQ